MSFSVRFIKMEKVAGQERRPGLPRTMNMVCITGGKLWRPWRGVAWSFWTGENGCGWVGGEGAPRFSMSQTPFLSPSTVFIHLIAKSSVSSLNITNSSSQCFHCKHSTDIQETEPPKYEMMNILENLCVVGHAGDVLASKRIVSVCLLADLLAGGSPGSQAGFSFPLLRTLTLPNSPP